MPVENNENGECVILKLEKDENGDKKTAQMSGTPARIVQHETDHLDGKLFIDYLSPVRREMVTRKIKKRK